MARFGRRNSKLDSFLKRNTDRGVYERVRAYEPCVVKSERVRRPAYMHVVLSDECVYLAQYPPRTLTAAVHFSQVQHIQLVNDIPVFLSGRDREHCQHIRVVYTTTTKPAAKRPHWLRRGKGPRLPAAAPPPPPPRKQLSVPPTLEGVSSLLHDNRWRITPEPLQRGQRVEEDEDDEEDDDDDDDDDDEGEIQRMATMQRMLRSASCPNPETLMGVRGLPSCPPPPSQPLSPLLFLSPPSPLSPSHWSSTVSTLVQLSGRRDSLARLLRRQKVSGAQEETKGQRDGEEVEFKREVELHLYSVSKISHIYLHLQSSWNSYIIRATLLLDPLYRRTCNIASSSSSHKQPPSISWERTCHLFSQLRGELLQENNSVESVFLLLQELHTAAHRDITLRTLFWRSSDLCVFLVETLEGTLHSCTDKSPKCVNTKDQLLLCTVVVQTLALMFRETEVEPSRHAMLTGKRGGLTSRLLLALVCDPHCCHNSALTSEYQDAACSLLFELVLLGQEASRCSSVENFLTVGWILRVLQPHPHLCSFLDHQAQQVVRVWSDSDQGLLGPVQAVLLFQRCRVLVTCLQHSGPLERHLQNHFREEFRYYVKGAYLKERLLHHYPISQPAARLVTQLQALILQT